MVEFDVLIENTKIVEGTGKKTYKGNIGIKGDKIVALGELKQDAKNIIDGKGLTALPGFIDAHSHADEDLLWFPFCESYVMQGVTTFVGGECGGSQAPLGEYVHLPSILNDHLVELDPYKFYPKQSYYPLEQVNEWMKKFYNWTLDWNTMEGFFKRVERTGISINYAPLVGHGTIRTKVMGLDYKRQSTDKEQAKMRDFIAQAMEEGCIGLSTGLDYDPDVFASQEEIIDGVKLLKDYGGLYCPHWRRTGRRRDIALGHIYNEKIAALMECVEVYRKTGVRLHFAHLTTGWELTPPQEEMEEANVRVTIDMITKDSKGELDITWDCMPFMMPGARDLLPYLSSLLEPWLRELGSRAALGRWLKVKDFRDELSDSIRIGKWYMRENYNPNTNPRWAENIFVVKSKSPGIEWKIRR